MCHFYLLTWVLLLWQTFGLQSLFRIPPFHISSYHGVGGACVRAFALEVVDVRRRRAVAAQRPAAVRRHLRTHQTGKQEWRRIFLQAEGLPDYY